MKCLFAGLGSIGQRHLKNLRSLTENADILAYRVRGETSVIDNCEILPGKNVEDGIKVYRNLQDALDERPNVVFVANPTSMHVPVAIEAARAGCHLFIEKPLSSSMERVDELSEIVERNGLVAFVAYQMRFHPALRTVRDKLQGGSIGRVLFAKAEVGEYMPGFHPFEDYRRTYAARKDMGGGVTLSQIHEIDYLCALFGRPERVFSLGGKLSGLDIDVDDVSSSLIKFPSIQVMLHQDFIQNPPQRVCSIVGEEGRIEWDLRKGSIMLYGERTQEKTFVPCERNDLFLKEMSHFLGCVRNGNKPKVGLSEAAVSLKTALAILESQKTGNPVEVK